MAFAVLGRPDEAISAYRRSIELDPNSIKARRELGHQLLRAKKVDEAVEVLEGAVRASPEDAPSHYLLGNAYHAQSRSQDAVVSYRQAVDLDPQLYIAHRGLGNVLVRQKRVEEAAESMERAVRLHPGDAISHQFLGNIYRDQNRTAEAIASYRKALAIDPELAMARLGECMAQLLVIYDDEEEVAEQRAAYERSLLELRDFYEGKPQEVLARAASAVGSVQPFLLAYQGQNDRGLQALYGELMCRLTAAAYPQWSEPLSMPAPGADGRINVGILSGYFHPHSNWKIPIKGWVEQLDRSKVRLSGYYTQNQHDAFTALAAKTIDRFVTGPKSLSQWAETIRGDNLHALIIPELGMDPMTARLAAMRLAPVQCGSLGHPETSGFSTMDYFLSSDLMEPENGQDHYTEKLVRLPNLSVHYSLPELQAAEVSRAELGVREDSIAYWCCQSLFKYLPRFDDLFPSIAAEVGNCQFVFIGHKSKVTTGRFQARLARAFARFGLDAEQYCVFVDRLPPHRFAGAMKSVDLFLDSLGWSGCNTTMEAIGVGLPVITCPGELMRGRHTAAILKMLGLEQAIAETPEAYVELAVALGRDAERREELHRLTLERHTRAYHDLACVRGLEDFLCGVAGSK